MQSVFRFPVAVGLTLAVLAACSPEVPDSGAGIGFGTEEDAIRARELELAGAPASVDRLVPPQALSSEALPAAPATIGTPQSVRTPATVATAQSGSSADIAAETAAALAASSSVSGPSAAQTGTPAPETVVNSGGLSAENDFAAVSGQRSIQGDAALIAGNQAQYQVIEPTAVPTRTDTSQPNVVGYALSTSHPPGTRLYSRSGINLNSKAERNCGRFASADLAQIEFLSTGGPERDRAGLDPDGDGYACGWDPTPFRRAVSN